MTIDPQDLRDAITTLRDDFFHLEELKWERAKTAETPRKIKSNQCSRTPAPDGDWSLDLEDRLLEDRREKQDSKDYVPTPGEVLLPGGLYNMARDALNHTRAAGTPITPRTGGIVCAHLWRNADEIVANFPEVEALLDLLRAQHRFLQHQFTKREGHQPQPRPEARQPSNVIITLLAQNNITITRDQLNYWAKRGYITREPCSDGRSGYLISEIIKKVTGP